MVELTMKRRPFYECKIYLGSVCYLTNEVFTQDQVEQYCGESQEAYDYAIPVRITPTTFVSGTDYHEAGWEIAAINYPRIEITSTDINDFMGYLAAKLIKRFNQNRICIVNPTEVIMVEP